MTKPTRIAELPDHARACRALASAWEEARDGALLPNRDRLTPRRLTSILPMVGVLEYQTSETLVFRLLGTRLSQYVGHLVGRNNQDLAPPEVRSERIARWRGMAETPCGGFAKVGLAQPGGYSLNCDSIALPVLPKGQGPLQFFIVFEEVVSPDPGYDLGRVYQDRLHAVPADFSFLDIGAGFPPG